MNYHENKNSKFVKFISGKGFYAVLALCMVAIGVAGYVAMANLGAKEPEEQPSPSSVFQLPGGISQNSTIKEDSPVANSTPSQSYESVTQSVPQEVKKPVASYFVLPVTGEIIKDFSNTELQFSNTYGDMRMHAGVDIAPNSGNIVKSAGDGYVTEVDESPDYGNVVTIDHGNGITAKYCGLKNVTVKKNSGVSAGQALGEIGTVPCECVDKAHLHLEIYKDGKAVSPFSLMDKVGE